MGTGFTPIKRKSFFREWVGWDTILLLAVLFSIVGFLFGNSNHTYPPKPPAPVAEIDKYKIITIDGECWVLPGDEYLIDAAIMKGDYLGECAMYLRNIK